MSLNNEDSEIHQLAQAITLIERQPGKASVVELLEIADRAAGHLKRPYLDHGDLLYDGSGLAK